MDKDEKREARRIARRQRELNRFIFGTLRKRCSTNKQRNKVINDSTAKRLFIKACETWKQKDKDRFDDHLKASYGFTHFRTESINTAEYSDWEIGPDKAMAPMGVEISGEESPDEYFARVMERDD